jgi:hypothetical protein
VKSRDKEDGAHQDMIVFFGYQGPTKFYYIHFGMKTDEKSNQIQLVNDAPRMTVSVRLSVRFAHLPHITARLTAPLTRIHLADTLRPICSSPANG